MLFLPRASHNFSPPLLIKSKGCVKDKKMGLAPLVLNEKNQTENRKKAKQGAQNAFFCKQLFPKTGKKSEFYEKTRIFLSSFFFRSLAHFSFAACALFALRQSSFSAAALERRLISSFGYLESAPPLT